MSSFHFYRWNQFKVIPLACTLRTPYKKHPQIFCDVRRRWQRGRLRWHHSLAGSQSLSTIESRDTKPRRMQKVNRLAYAQIAECLEQNTVLWPFHTIQPCFKISSTRLLALQWVKGLPTAWLWHSIHYFPKVHLQRQPNHHFRRKIQHFSGEDTDKK